VRPALAQLTRRIRPLERIELRLTHMAVGDEDQRDDARGSLWLFRG